jgi:hypothetical protein
MGIEPGKPICGGTLQCRAHERLSGVEHFELAEKLLGLTPRIVWREKRRAVARLDSGNRCYEFHERLMGQAERFVLDAST